MGLSRRYFLHLAACGIGSAAAEAFSRHPEIPNLGVKADSGPRR